MVPGHRAARRGARALRPFTAAAALLLLALAAGRAAAQPTADAGGPYELVMANGQDVAANFISLFPGDASQCPSEDCTCAGAPNPCACFACAATTADSAARPAPAAPCPAAPCSRRAPCVASLAP